MKVQLTKVQQEAVGWLIHETAEYEKGLIERRLKLARIFDTWFPSGWENFQMSDLSVEVSLPGEGELDGAP